MRQHLVDGFEPDAAPLDATVFIAVDPRGKEGTVEALHDAVGLGRWG